MVKNTNGWLQFEEETSSFKSWTEVRDEFFEKFVTTKQLARRVFEEKFIEEGQSPEHFLYELRLLADVAGMTCNPNYKTILRDRFLYGLQNATAFQFYYLHKEMFPDVNAVLKQFRSSGRLRKDNLNELKLSKGEEFSLTKNVIDFAGSSRGSRKHLSTPSRLSNSDKEKKKKYQVLYGNNNSEEECDADFIVNDNSGIPEGEFKNLHLQDKQNNCETCGGRHKTQSCFKTKECPHCKVMGHDLVNCYRLCKCRILLSLQKSIPGIPHPVAETCPVNWDKVLGSVANGSKNE